MGITETIVTNLAKHYHNKKDILDLMHHPEKLSQALNDYGKLPSFMDEDELIENLLPKSLGVLTSQKVELMITQLDDNLKSIDDTKIEINSLCIEDINLDLNSGGFNGAVLINLPYSTTVPDEYSILFQNQPLQIELKITSEYRQDQTLPLPKEKSINNILSLKGLVDLKKGIKHNYIFNDRNQQIYKSKEPFFKPYVSINIHFIDTLRALWDEHYSVSIYPEKCYKDIFDDVNQNYYGLINFDYDQSAESLTSIRPFITLNCDYQNKYSLYDFLISVLDGYGLSLFYNYAEDVYQITDAKVWLDKLKQIQLDAKNSARISEIILTTSAQHRDINLFDTNYSVSESSFIKPILQEQWNESTSALPETQTSHLINRDIKKDADLIKQTHCNNNYVGYKLETLNLKSEINSPISLKSEVAPLYDFPLQPIALIKFDENTESLTYKQKGFPVTILMHSKFHLKPTLLWKILRKNWGATKESLDIEKKHDLTRSTFANDSLNKRPALLFNYTVVQSMWFKSSVTISLPREPKIQPSLFVETELYTTSNDDTENTQNHLLFDMYESKVTTTNSSSSGTIYAAGLQDYLHSQCYLFNFPKTLLPKNIEMSPFLIPMNVFEGNKMPNFYSLLTSGTKVRLEVGREKSQINTILNYQVPDQIFANGDSKQNHYLNFENREEIQAYISHEYDLSDKSSSLNIASTQEEGARSFMLSDKKIQMKYQLKS